MVCVSFANCELCGKVIPDAKSARYCGCEDDPIKAAERILRGQYRVTTQGRDVELAAKDRWLVAAALMSLINPPAKSNQHPEEAAP